MPHLPVKTLRVKRGIDQVPVDSLGMLLVPHTPFPNNILLLTALSYRGQESEQEAPDRPRSSLPTRSTRQRRLASHLED